MPIVHVESLEDPRLADYRHLPDPELLRRGEIFIAEGRLVVRTLLAESPLAVRSVLLTENARRGLADALEPRVPTLPVFIVPEGTLAALTGFNLHRGCLAVGERPRRERVGALLGRMASVRRLVLLEQIGNADNLGGIFRNAAAFGVDAVVLGPGCCDPLYRKAIRVSMGAALRVPFCHATDWPADLDAIRAAGIKVAALTPSPAAVAIASWAADLPSGARLALLAGSEGAGLSEAALTHADAALRIPMAPGMDSLNVATAVGIALHCCFDPGREAWSGR
jgi:tRNA G18 (ribose-2'-O)-methylase SpoU